MQLVAYMGLTIFPPHVVSAIIYIFLFVSTFFAKKLGGG